MKLKGRLKPVLMALTSLMFTSSLCANEPDLYADNEDTAEKISVESAQDLSNDIDSDNPWVLAMKAATHGPSEIKLVSQGVLSLPEGYVFVPKKEAAAIMDMWGNSVGSSFQGMVISDQDNDQWFGVLDYIPSGYIKDDDAKDWDADELLDSIKEGTEQQNEMRRQRGIPEMEIVGWVQTPLYKENDHHLVYSISSKDKGVANDANQGINYNTYVLGREGYIQLNLVTGLDKISADKLHASTLLSALKFNEGKRYEQYNADTDHTAEYGLAALVAGAAAKKVGLFAALGVFLLKAWKIILIALLAVGAGIKKFMRKSEN